MFLQLLLVLMRWRVTSAFTESWKLWSSVSLALPCSVRLMLGSNYTTETFPLSCYWQSQQETDIYLRLQLHLSGTTHCINNYNLSLLQYMNTDTIYFCQKSLTLCDCSLLFNKERYAILNIFISKARLAGYIEIYQSITRLCPSVKILIHNRPAGELLTGTVGLIWEEICWGAEKGP